MKPNEELAKAIKELTSYAPELWAEMVAAEQASSLVGIIVKSSMVALYALFCIVAWQKRGRITGKSLGPVAFFLVFGGTFAVCALGGITDDIVSYLYPAAAVTKGVLP